MHNNGWLFIVLIVNVTISFTHNINAKVITKRETEGIMEMDIIPSKRPFCNAFTGCGKKRSERLNFVDVKTLDPNDLPRFTKLNRKIPQEVLLWEQNNHKIPDMASFGFIDQRR